MELSEEGRLICQSVGTRALHEMCGEWLKIKEEYPLTWGAAAWRPVAMRVRKSTERETVR